MAAYGGNQGFRPPGNQAAGGPAGHGWVVDPSDTVDLPATTRGVWVGGAGSGNLTVQMAGSVDPVAFASIAAGTFLPICVTRIFDTGTDVTAIVALW